MLKLQHTGPCAALMVCATSLSTELKLAASVIPSLTRKKKRRASNAPQPGAYSTAAKTTSMLYNVMCSIEAVHSACTGIQNS